MELLSCILHPYVYAHTPPPLVNLLVCASFASKHKIQTGPCTAEPFASICKFHIVFYCLSDAALFYGVIVQMFIVLSCYHTLPHYILLIV